MAKHHRVFIAFAIEDETSRDFLVGQARNQRTPFEFTDMSVKDAWQSDWKTKVRSRIRGCDGVIALVSSKTYGASGARFEMEVAKSEGIPMIGLRVKQGELYLPPPELLRVSIIPWTWDGIAAFLKSL